VPRWPMCVPMAGPQRAWPAWPLTTTLAPLHYQGQSLRIDRLVQRRGAHPADAAAGWWVLDYKSAAQPQRQQALVAQLERYREAVSVLMSGEAVYAAFLTGDGRLVMVGDAPGGAGAYPAKPPAVGHTLAPAAPVVPAKTGHDRAASGPADSPQGSLF